MSGHAPVLLQEALTELAIKPDGIYVDGTFGRGGHAQAIWRCLNAKGCLVVFDRDPEAIEAAQALAKTLSSPARFVVVHDGFAAMAERLVALGIEGLDGVLLDLGISSPQVDKAERGFSFRYDGPLDMRMDNSQGLTAAEWLAIADVEMLEKIFYDYSQERYARAIAKKIVAARAVKHFSTTRELALCVCAAVPAGPRQQDSTTRVFQAIRIAVNQEITQLTRGLSAAQQLLKVDGRLVVISFHSVEDRMVKQFLRGTTAHNRISRLLPPAVPEWQDVKRCLPSNEEIRLNPRSASAVLRSARRAL